jgi:hypothetical protein
MTELNAGRRWKAVALAALAALVLSLVGWASTAAVQERQLRAAQEQAEEAKKEADRARHEERQARDRAEQALYVRQIELAARAFADDQRKAEKP